MEMASREEIMEVGVDITLLTGEYSMYFGEASYLTGCRAR